MAGFTALIDFSDPYHPDGVRTRHAFGVPCQVLVAQTVAEVREVLAQVQAAAERGLWCVGYLRYEAAPAFDPAFVVHPGQAPLARFALYAHALPWPQDERGDANVPAAQDEPEVHWDGGLERAEFERAVAHIQQAIADGELYQVNLTARLRGVLKGERLEAGALAAAGRSLFAAMQRAQPRGYAAYLDAGDGEQVLSVSPELFFDWHGGQLLTRPMKGTAPRGTDPEQDAQQAQALRASPKERAENVMIVDLLRNDVSRIAQPHSVRVERLFDVQALPSVWQMTSDVLARTRPGCSLVDVFGALFPCGSVTGAPKVRAMQMIHALEPDARGVYCGAVGVVRPGGHATFNVPIRTVALQGAVARCGIGSGITAYANAQGEWSEWRHKRAFIQRASAPFSVLETLALVDGSLRNGAAHVQRMRAAAGHFGFPWNAVHLEQALAQVVREQPNGAWRVRLLLDARGGIQVQAFPLDASPARVRLQLAERAMEQADGEFVRFKTTRRAHYDAFNPRDPEVFDTVLWNSRGQVTECTRGNVAFLLDGRWVTPPLECGLLPGVGRAQALRDGRVHEAVVMCEDLERVQAAAFLNSLRGWIDADLPLWRTSGANPATSL